MGPKTSTLPRSFRWRAYGGLLALLAFIGLGGFVLIQAEAKRLRSTAEAENLRLVTAGAHAATHGLQQMLAAVTSMQSLVASLALSHAEKGARERRMVESLLTEVAVQERFGIVQIAAINADGWLDWSTLPHFTPIDLSDRDHIRVHREGQRQPFVSVPLVGRTSMRWTLNITTAILEPDGRFAGVAVVSVDPVTLSDSLGDLQFADGVTVNLLRQDGVILAHSQSTHAFLGATRDGPDLARINREPSGQMLTVGPLSGRPIFLGWRQILGWPLAVTFAIDAEAAMRDAVRQSNDLNLLLLLLLVMLAIAGLLLVELRARRAVRVALEATEASRAEVSRLLNALPGAAYRGIVDLDGTYTRLHLSPVIGRITGWPATKFTLPGSFTAAIAEEFRGHRRDFYAQIRKSQHGSTEYWLFGASGQPVWVRDECRLIGTLPDGQIEVVGLITDITAERHLKAQALSSAKLATLGEMAAGVAHELNQPCAAITLAADVAALELDRGGADYAASARGRLDEIARQAIRMRGVIDHFRIFARVDGGEETAVAWPEIIEGALSIAGGTMLASGVRIETEVAPHLPEVRGSVVALEQVLVNLLVNARDAMEGQPEPQRLVRIVCQPTADGGEVLLTLRDHGTGIRPELLERSFEPFFTTKPVGKGTGLGLSIAYGTIRSFGGSIVLRNHPEGGAEVEIRLAVPETTRAEGVPTEAS